jgi:hypothetical protein
MSLLPYALRPKVILRSAIIKRGVVGGSPLFRPIAMLMVGQGEYIRARALRHGVVLGSRYWRIIGTLILLQDAQRGIRRRPEHVTIERVRPNQRLQIVVADPDLSGGRRHRRQRLRTMRAEAEAGVAASRRS